jgi:hypothetical protein
MTRARSLGKPFLRSLRVKGHGVMLQRSIVMALLMLLATPAAAEWHLPCLFGLLGGCSTVIPLSRDNAARPLQPLNPQAALEEVNAFRANIWT